MTNARLQQIPVMTTDPAIHIKALHDELVTRIRKMIMEGELRPGARVPEQALCSRFGVSRTPLREAIKILAAEGLLRLLPNRGATVVSVTREEAEEIIPVLGMLEALAGELACMRLDQAGTDAIVAMHVQMIEHYRQGDEEAYGQLDAAIHAAIFAAAGNHVLAEAHHGLRMRLCTLQGVARKTPPRWEEAIEDHEGMMRALQTRDGAAFAATARRHIRHNAEIVSGALDVLESGEGASLHATHL
jgi:DNA-binding GntR family transcriptional regulator